jgi:hypothetical protein
MPPDSGGGANRPAAQAEHALMGVPIVVEPYIEADDGVIHRTELMHLPPEALRSF